MPADVSALQLVLSRDAALFAIVRLSLYVSLSAVVLAALIGIPLGAWIALTRFPGRQGVIVMLNALMGLPPVVVGLAVYLALSRSGPLGSFGLLFTPRAMIIAQTVLVAPIIAARSSVVFPEPLGPISTVGAPGAKVSAMLSRIVTRPAVTLTPSKTTGSSSEGARMVIPPVVRQRGVRSRPVR